MRDWHARGLHLPARATNSTASVRHRFYDARSAVSGSSWIVVRISWKSSVRYRRNETWIDDACVWTFDVTERCNYDACDDNAHRRWWWWWWLKTRDSWTVVVRFDGRIDSNKFSPRCMGSPKGVSWWKTPDKTAWPCFVFICLLCVRNLISYSVLSLTWSNYS